ncbi:MAG: Gfo/Idh/MocA family oxidoreductase, partial [Clostridia bacterium]|nr:Gfo/Idh/MocA family oxidoreductase [Clostridia bacterium]
MTEPVSAIIVGAGHRSMIYAGLSDIEPDKLKIVGIAEPDESRRNMVAKKYNIPPEHCFKDVDELVKVPKFADAAINGTMDQIHVETSIPLMNAGYDLLLEKPFAVNEEETRELVECARKTNRKIMVCFVLRYTDFYREIKKVIASGEIGDIINIQMAENVSYHHMLTSYVRGKWSNSNRCHTSMLLAKSSHDIDIMMWLMDKDKPVKVSSFGSLMQFRKENAPENSGTRCVVDCPIEESCPYSAKKVYYDHPDHWSCYVWDKFDGRENVSDEERLELLKTSPYGVCAYKSDNNVVDHQSICIQFESGATGTHNMTGGSSYSVRTIHIIGTKGEINGSFESGK